MATTTSNRDLSSSSVLPSDSDSTDLPYDSPALLADLGTATTACSATSRDSDNQVECPAIEVFHQSITLPSPSWMDVSASPVQSITLCKVSNVPTVSTQPVIISHCLKIESDLTWTLFVHNHKLVKEKCSSLEAFPGTLSSESLRDLLLILDQLHVCCGQPDTHFVSMVNAKKGKILSSDGKVAAIVDSYAPVGLNGEHYLATVRTGSCELVAKSQKCVSCKSYRDTLRSMYNRRRTCEMSDTSSHSNERYLNTPEKKAKMSKLKQKARVAEKQNEKLRARIAELTEKQGDPVDPTFHVDLLIILNENYEQIKQTYPEGSFARLFWEEQLKAATVKDPRQIRWHPLMIKWCLNLKLISSAAYHTVQSSGFLRLPH